MATTTPNFGWPVPTSTDLVKDGAVAIEGLGDAIDASLLDLKGGTSGQVLKKNSNTDMDFVWSADSAGMTNPMTTTGDTIYSSSGSTPARLGIGSTGQVLTVAGGVPSWATPASSSPAFVGCSIYNTTTTSVSNNTTTTLNYNSEIFDTNGFHSTSTNTDRVTIPTGYAGKYLVTYAARFDVNGTGGRSIGISKNGSQIVEAAEGGANSTTYQILTRSVILDLAVGDYLTFQVFQSSGTSLLMYMRIYEMPIQVQWLGA